MTACHNLNGLEDGETWRRTGTLLGGEALAHKQTVTSACHHCVEPGCMTGCPVRAYEKDPVTGIVRHLDDQCIGCRYCLFTCPFDVPQFSSRLGIVRKCDMCSDRLSVGEAPACVQACPTEAIAIRTTAVADAARAADAGPFLPGAPDPAITVPTTHYKSSRPLPRNTLPADFHQIRREDAHPPLAVMLVLTQVAVGLFGAGQLLPGALGDSSAAALAIAVFALGASVLHLGRPQYAFRAILGLKTSWLSREIVLFGGFVGLALGHAVAHRWLPGDLARIAGLAATGVGIAAVFGSAMVYAATKRPCWRLPLTGPLFFATTVAGGTSAAAAIAFALGSTASSQALAGLAAGAVALKLASEAILLAKAGDRRVSPLRQRAQLLLGPARALTFARFVFGLAGAAAMALAAWSVPTAASLGAGAIAVVVGELLERHSYFIAAAAPRMPGELP